jgi:hypothetical protein
MARYWRSHGLVCVLGGDVAVVDECLILISCVGVARRYTMRFSVLAKGNREPDVC